MVSSVSSLFRPRRDPNNKKKKTTVSASDDSKTVEASVAESVPEIIVEPSTSTSSEMSSTVQEVIVETVENATYDQEKPENPPSNGNTGKVTIVETSEEVDQCGCSLAHSLDIVKSAVQDIPPEYKEAARYSGLASASLVVLFIAVVIFRVIHHFMAPENDGFFCTYFAGPFSPMFDAVCAEHADLWTEITVETSRLASEVTGNVCSVFSSMFAGFHAFGTIFWALFGGIWEVIVSGVHELAENMNENLTFLIRFCFDFVYAICSILVHMIVACLNLVLVALTSIKHIFVAEEPRTWF